MAKLEAGQVIGLVGHDVVTPGRVVLNPTNGKFIDLGTYMKNLPPAVQLTLPEFSNVLMSAERVDLPANQEPGSVKPNPKNFAEKVLFKMADLIPTRRI